MPSVRSDFREYRVGEPPEDWAPWILANTNANVTRMPTQHVYGNFLECWLPDGATPGSLAGYAFEPAGEIGDCEVIVRFEQGGEVRTEDKLVALRAGGTEGDEHCALLTVFQIGSQVQIHLTTWDGGVESGVAFFVLGTAGSVLSSILRPIEVRFRVTGGRTAGDGAAWVRAWLYGDPEPETWQIEDEPVSVDDTGRMVWIAGDDRDDHRLLGFSLSFE